MAPLLFLPPSYEVRSDLAPPQTPSTMCCLIRRLPDSRAHCSWTRTSKTPTRDEKWSLYKMTISGTCYSDGKPIDKAVMLQEVMGSQSIKRLASRENQTWVLLSNEKPPHPHPPKKPELATTNDKDSTSSAASSCLFNSTKTFHLQHH